MYFQIGNVAHYLPQTTYQHRNFLEVGVHGYCYIYRAMPTKGFMSSNKNEIILNQIFTISNFFSLEECENYIKLTKNIGYTDC
jgi:hypothetical protein